MTPFMPFGAASTYEYGAPQGAISVHSDQQADILGGKLMLSIDKEVAKEGFSVALNLKLPVETSIISFGFLEIPKTATADKKLPNKNAD